MTANNAAQASSRRRKASAQPAAPEATGPTDSEAKAMAGENTSGENGSESSKENVVNLSARPASTEAESGGLQLRESGSLATDRPVMSSELEIVGTITVAGVRPIGASHLELAGSFLNGRPIAASPVKVEEMLPGGRPIFASEFHEVEGLVLAGHRPIMLSDPKLMSASLLPGGRPIAANDVDPEPGALMGYLD